MNVETFRVGQGEKVDLSSRPTVVPPIYLDKKDYKKQLKSRVKHLRRDAGEALRPRHLRPAARLPGHGHGRQGRRHPARHVRREPAGHAGLQLQAPIFDGARPRLPLAHDRLPYRSAAASASSTARTTRRCSSSASTRRSSQPSACPTALPKDKSIWDKRYESIRDHEEHLHRNGTRIVKFFLHVSKEEQRKRLLARIDDPSKNWKASPGDIAEREFWDDYMQRVRGLPGRHEHEARALVRHPGGRQEECAAVSSRRSSWRPCNRSISTTQRCPLSASTNLSSARVELVAGRLTHIRCRT